MYRLSVSGSLLQPANSQPVCDYSIRVEVRNTRKQNMAMA